MLHHVEQRILIGLLVYRDVLAGIGHEIPEPKVETKSQHHEEDGNQAERQMVGQRRKEARANKKKHVADHDGQNSASFIIDPTGKWCGDGTQQGTGKENHACDHRIGTQDIFSVERNYKGNPDVGEL